MKTLYMDTRKLNTVTSLHQYLKNELKFPDYYGGNLDALYDMLTTIHHEVEIYIFNDKNNPDPNFCRYMKRFLQVMQDAEMENHHLTVIIE